ncbi:hypothetical protein C7458_11417 [Williamsia muralis]|nr:hypothetical protein C7458_11417 [Williamsia marianensis]
MDEYVFGLTVVLMWVYSAGSAWVGLQATGRTSLAIGAAPVGNAVGVVRFACMVGIMTLVVLLIARNIGSVANTSLLNLVYYLAPSITITLLVFLYDAQIGLGVAMYALFGLSVWLSDIRQHCVAIIGWLTVLLAAVSMLLAIADSELGLTARGTGRTDEKAIFGETLLAGPFASPNTLGLLLALGLPAVWAFRRRSSSVVCSLLIGVALLWSASRSSIIAALCALLCLILVRRGFTRIAAMVPVVALAVVVILPILTTDSTAFTGRGRIWLGSMEQWYSHKILGAGPDFYQRLHLYWNSLGQTAFHGHNLLVTTLVTGGLVTATALVLLIFRFIWISANRAPINPVFLAWISAFCAAGVLESTLDIRSPGYIGWITWPLFTLLLLGRTESNSPSDRARKEDSRSATASSLMRT